MTELTEEIQKKRWFWIWVFSYKWILKLKPEDVTLLQIQYLFILKFLIPNLNFAAFLVNDFGHATVVFYRTKSFYLAAITVKA